LDAPWLHLPTWITLTAAINAAIALAMIASSPRRSPLLREAPQAWQRGIAILSLGWLLLAYRDHWPDAISLIGANTLLALGVAECVRALRRFAGLGEAVVPLAAIVAAVFAVSVVFGLIWPSRFLRLSFNTLAIAVLFLAGARAALRAPSEVRIGNRLVVGGIFAAAGLAALLRVTVFVLHGEDAMPPPDAFTPEQLLFYLLFGLGPPAASLAFVLMGNDRLITELSRLAGEDPLTGLGNRRQFDQAAQSLLARPRTHPVALLLLDIDRFKAINDLHWSRRGRRGVAGFRGAAPQGERRPRRRPGKTWRRGVRAAARRSRPQGGMGPRGKASVAKPSPRPRRDPLHGFDRRRRGRPRGHRLADAHAGGR
jgi:predicted signal transduction protein with EAL and GGDEF domain